VNWQNSCMTPQSTPISSRQSRGDGLHATVAGPTIRPCHRFPTRESISGYDLISCWPAHREQRVRPLPHIRSHTQRQYIARKLIGGLAIISQKDASCRSVEIRWTLNIYEMQGAPPGRGRREAMTIDEIIDNFSLLDDWDDRYRYVIELGRGLAPLDEWDRNQAGKVRAAQGKFGWRRRFARTEGMVRCCRSRATAMPISCAD
jgi:hypothetical protein